MHSAAEAEAATSADAVTLDASYAGDQAEESDSSLTADAVDATAAAAGAVVSSGSALGAADGRAGGRGPASGARAVFIGPSWHNLAIAPTSLVALAKTGSCYLREVRFVGIAVCACADACVLMHVCRFAITVERVRRTSRDGGGGKEKKRESVHVCVRVGGGAHAHMCMRMHMRVRTLICAHVCVRLHAAYSGNACDCVCRHKQRVHTECQECTLQWPSPVRKCCMLPKLLKFHNVFPQHPLTSPKFEHYPLTRSCPCTTTPIWARAPTAWRPCWMRRSCGQPSRSSGCCRHVVARATAGCPMVA
jgi:hypothetical protein